MPRSISEPRSPPSPLYLLYISPISPLNLRVISAISLTCGQADLGAEVPYISPASPLYLRHISATSPTCGQVDLGAELAAVTKLDGAALVAADAVIREVGALDRGKGDDLHAARWRGLPEGDLLHLVRSRG